MPMVWLAGNLPSRPADQVPYYSRRTGGPEDEMTDGTADLLTPANAVHTKGVLPLPARIPPINFREDFLSPIRASAGS